MDICDHLDGANVDVSEEGQSIDNAQGHYKNVDCHYGDHQDTFHLWNLFAVEPEFVHNDHHDYQGHGGHSTVKNEEKVIIRLH